MDEIEKERREREKEKEFENDKDKDGIKDKSDMCPDEYGDALANGCPDADKDGVPDKYDLCPNLYGPVELQGCPDLTDHEKEILSMALGNLKFNFDSDVIKSFSYKTLTKLTALLLSNPTMNIFIEGHASSEGTDDYNMDLSAARVKAVQKFFVSKGVDKGRVDMDWEGESDPLNTNSNETQRAENRRVEFDIKHHPYDNNTALKLKEEYFFMLNKINPGVSLTTPIIPQVPSSSVVQEEELVNTEEKDTTKEVAIEQDSINLEEELMEKDTVIDEINEDTETEDSLIIIDTIIKDSPSNNIVAEEIAESNVAGNKDYILVVLVSSNLENTKDFIAKSDENLNYIEDKGKFYVYVFSNANREFVEQFRSVYKKDCWIKNP
jgi:outer membrane protein OmpA-like peptidoglycan-associated protein